MFPVCQILTVALGELLGAGGLAVEALDESVKVGLLICGEVGFRMDVHPRKVGPHHGVHLRRTNVFAGAWGRAVSHLTGVSGFGSQIVPHQLEVLAHDGVERCIADREVSRCGNRRNDARRRKGSRGWGGTVDDGLNRGGRSGWFAVLK
ncbi:MAG: hypothetical protein BWY82_00327 [Verrucomicrobia bacterium ADurb.Bin474]|nr:MAG: hypothetical protein BWY82_00327 [Verrucomicrobia bacterium ADurb.Bin474]